MKAGYPITYFGGTVVPCSSGALSWLAEYKTFTNTALKSSAILDVGHFIDGVLYDKSFQIISIYGLLATVQADGLDQVTNLFLKRDGSLQGDGIAKIDALELAFEVLSQFGNCIIQTSVKQHEFFDEIVTGPLSAIRITTTKETDGAIRTRAAYLRTGRSDDEINCNLCSV